VYHYRRDYERSLRQVRRALDLDANDIEAHIVMALNYEQQRKYPEAIAELEKAHQLSDYNPLVLAPLASCYGGAGNKEKALQLLDELNAASAEVYVAPISRVMVYLGIGDLENAFQWLEKAAEARDALLCYLKVGPIYDAIRDDPRYTDLLYRIGLANDDSSELRTVTHHTGKAAVR
jgi:tetratricopeptide (TPR) repeat protein